ncbi:MAG: thioredoxin family protein [Pseudomonadales bacterium]|nr:thioredoxin family protein [Pseudomonadales bacterium]
MYKFAVILTGLFLSSIAQGGDIFRCTVNGKVVFTDEPCNGSTVELSPMNVVPAMEGRSFNTSYNNSKWYTNVTGYYQALRMSKRYKTPVFIYYQADWCGYCRRLEKNLLYRPETQAALNKVIKVKITPDNSLKEHTLSKEMGVTGYPTVLIQKDPWQKPNKVRLMKKKNGKWRTMSTRDFNHWIDTL